MPSPSRILMTADAGGSVWNYAMELARALRPRQVEIILAVMGPFPSPAQRLQAASIDNIRLFHRPFALEWMNNPWTDITDAGEWLLELEERFCPDVIHLNGYCHGSLPWSAPVLIAAHSCALCRWRDINGQSGWMRYRAEVVSGLRGANRLVAPSQAMLQWLSDIYGLPARASCSKVIPLGRDASLFPPLGKWEIVLSAGRVWDGGKNLLALAKVAPEIPWPVFIAGSTEGPDGQISELPDRDESIWLGRIPPEELAEWMGCAAVFALPARFESFALSVLEAALAGCALVLGDIPSFREIWQDAAVFVPPDDCAALGTAIRQLMEDEVYREFMAQRARFRALAFTPERMAESYYECYRALSVRSDLLDVTDDMDRRGP